MDKLTQRRIVCAALQHKTFGDIIIGVRHYCPIMRQQIQGKDSNWSNQNVTQGFIDQFGEFHDRKAAWLIAEAASQIIVDQFQKGILFSENLY